MDRRYRSRSGKEFEEFVAQVSDDLVRIGYQLTYDAQETEDLVQEVLTRVARHWPRVRTMEYPMAYARRVLVNLAIDGGPRRSRRRGERQLDEESLEMAATVVEQADMRWIDSVSEIRWALSQLTPRQRAAVVARYWLELSEAETAQLMSCSVGTIKSSTSRALGRLRQLVADDTAASTRARQRGERGTS